MGGAWLNGAESRIALERRRGAEGHTRGARRKGDFRPWKKEGEEGKRERELPGRNKLARNERQIASELSARSPDVIEAAMPFLLRLRVSLCFLPSVSLTFSYFRLRPIDPLSLSISLFPPSLAVDRSPRSENRDRGSSSGFLSVPLSSLLHLLTPPPSFDVPPTTLMDACRPTRDPPRCPPTNFVHLVVRIRATRRRSSFAGYLPSRCTVFVDERSTVSFQFFFFSRPRCFRTLCDFLRAAAFAKSITRRPASAENF